jgi:hypothetical protein
MQYETEDEYDVAIAETVLAISRAKNAGHSHKNISGPDELSVTEVSIKQLMADLALLRREKEGITSTARAIIVDGIQ